MSDWLIFTAIKARSTHQGQEHVATCQLWRLREDVRGVRYEDETTCYIAMAGGGEIHVQHTVEEVLAMIEGELDSLQKSASRSQLYEAKLLAIKNCLGPEVCKCCECEGLEAEIRQALKYIEEVGL